MIRALVHIVATAAALLVLANMNIGIAVDGLFSALVVALIWGVMGLTVRPLLSLLTLPITILTFGLFSFVLNALLFWLLSKVVEGFEVTGFIAALAGSLVLAIVAWAVHRLF